jgi:hypothetical protein
MAQVKNPYPRCEHDGFPMVKIKGRLHCAAEYIDRCIGQQPVIDVIQRDQTTYYVFENGHELPLLCFCCAKPLATMDLAKTRRDLQGRRLDSMSVGTVPHESGQDFLQFGLEFSGQGWLFSKGVFVPVAPEVAVKMRHPPDCPYGKLAQKKATGRKKRKRRKR